MREQTLSKFNAGLDDAQEEEEDDQSTASTDVDGITSWNERNA